MYQALYRKYRPSTFDEIVGQEVIIKTLKNAINNNKLTHAYLFSGPRGTGKTSTAKILAKTINCQNINGLEPCNSCESCVKINNKQSTDIIEIDAASNNGVDEIRELKSKVNLVPSNSKYKVYIIDEVHMLSTGAFNALLKTLEEPPSHIIFILATTEPHKIPATILSRCQRFDFKKIGINKIVQNLKRIVEKENIAIEDDALREIAVLSQGGMRDSISLLDQAISYCADNIKCNDVYEISGTVGKEKMKDIVCAIENKDIVNTLKLFDELDEQGKNLIRLMEELNLYLRNALIYKLAPDYFENEESVEEYNVNINSDKILDYIKKISSAVYQMKNSDNEKILLELCMIELCKIGNNKKNDTTYLQTECNNENNTLKKESVENTQNKKEVVKFDSKIVDTKTETVENKGETVTTKSNIEVDDGFIKKIKTIRINNTLSTFDKKKLLEMKENIQLVKKYLFDEIYGQWVSLILDGELKALGNNYLLFVYKDRAMEELFNHNWEIIDEIFKETYAYEWKTVAVDLEDWNIIKNEFNSKTKIYTWCEEPKKNSNENDIGNKKNEIENMFGDIIEYN